MGDGIVPVLVDSVLSEVTLSYVENSRGSDAIYARLVYIDGSDPVDPSFFRRKNRAHFNLLTAAKVPATRHMTLPS